MIALSGAEAIGAAWHRLFPADAPGYGFVDSRTPELAMAVVPAYRGYGVGTEMLAHLIASADGRFPALSLSCDPGNPARRLYQQAGFHGDRTMILTFIPAKSA